MNIELRTVESNSATKKTKVVVDVYTVTGGIETLKGKYRIELNQYSHEINADAILSEVRSVLSTHPDFNE